MALVNELVPHQHFVIGRKRPISPSLKRIWLFVLAIAIHNFPEGLAVGVGFGTGDVANGVSLAIGIGLQTRARGPRRRAAFEATAPTELVEPIGGLLGAAAVAQSEPLLPSGRAFAA